MVNSIQIDFKLFEVDELPLEQCLGHREEHMKNTQDSRRKLIENEALGYERGNTFVYLEYSSVGLMIHPLISVVE